MGKGTALITGASSGIGAELARLCAGDGYELIVVARRAARLRGLAASLKVPVRCITADLSDSRAPQAIYEETRGTPIDILINNAGIAVRGLFAETDWSAQATLLEVNMVAPAHLTRLFLPDMVRRRSGRILNVASTAAFVPGPLMATYYASKAFLLSFSEAIANELKGTGVTATVLCPGPTHTEFFQAAGIEDSNLVQGGNVMGAAEVARIGYRAMTQGKVQEIAGARNRWMMRGVRFAPRSMVAQVTRRLNAGAQ